MKVKHGHDRKASQKNRYVMIDINPREEIDVFCSHGRDWEGGRSFYLTCVQTYRKDLRYFRSNILHIGPNAR